MSQKPVSASPSSLSPVETIRNETDTRCDPPNEFLFNFGDRYLLKDLEEEAVVTPVASRKSKKEATTAEKIETEPCRHYRRERVRIGQVGYPVSSSTSMSFSCSSIKSTTSDSLRAVSLVDSISSSSFGNFAPAESYSSMSAFLDQVEAKKKKRKKDSPSSLVESKPSVTGEAQFITANVVKTSQSSSNKHHLQG